MHAQQSINPCMKNWDENPKRITIVLYFKKAKKQRHILAYQIVSDSHKLRLSANESFIAKL